MDYKLNKINSLQDKQRNSQSFSQDFYCNLLERLYNRYTVEKKKQQAKTTKRPYQSVRLWLLFESQKTVSDRRQASTSFIIAAFAKDGKQFSISFGNHSIIDYKKPILEKIACKLFESAFCESRRTLSDTRLTRSFPAARWELKRENEKSTKTRFFV